MEKIIANLYAVMDKGPLRALSLIMALLLAGCIFWDPSRFAAKTSELEIWHGLLLMWAVCAGVVHGVGFRPRALHWQVFFCPPVAFLALLAGLVFFFV
ncbi:cyd operon protein YbgE [Kosakonia sp. YIM B13611]|uniref:cyd operon protein YbgE n=1 Tax=unclassified Kosakonia TaxID=2632876 RepID=UPI003673680B